MWTRVPAPGVDQVARVLDYFFCFPDRIEGPKTPFAFWRYRVNEILAEDDLIPDDPAEAPSGRKVTRSTRSSVQNKGNSGGSDTRQSERSTQSR